MEQIFPVKVYSPAKCVLSCEAQTVVLPASDGEIGILPGHNDLVCLLGTGVMHVDTGSKREWLMVSGGAVEVTAGAVSIYALSVEHPSEIEKTAVLEANKSNQAKLDHTNTFAPDYEPLKQELAKGAARLELLEKSGQKGS